MKRRAIELFHDEAGSGDPVVLICGLSADCRAWGYAFRALAERYRVVRYDHRGIGKSPRGSKPIDSFTLADDLLGLIDALGLGATHLVGASMGGAIAIIAATARPERVRSLTLAVTTPKNDAAHMAIFRDLRDLLASEGIEAYARRVAPLCVSESFGRSNPETIERIVKTLVERPSRAETILEQIDGCAGTDVTHLLPQIACPTLVLDAERDELILPAGPILLSAIAGAQGRTLSGCGHDIFVEEPDQTVRLILDFLARS